MHDSSLILIAGPFLRERLCFFAPKIFGIFDIINPGL